MVSFTTECEKYLQPNEVDSQLKYWRNHEGAPSVKEYYAKYFKSELQEFETDQVYWIQAKIENQLIGWATFEEDSSQKKSLYLNLLVSRSRVSRPGNWDTGHLNRGVQ